MIAHDSMQIIDIQRIGSLTERSRTKEI